MPPPGFNRGGGTQHQRGRGPLLDSAGNPNVPAFASREFCENQINNFINGPETGPDSNYEGDNLDAAPFSESGQSSSYSGPNSSHRGQFGGHSDSGPSRGGGSYRGHGHPPGGPFRGPPPEGPPLPIVGSGPLYARPHGTSDETRPWQDREGQLRPLSPSRGPPPPDRWEHRDGVPGVLHRPSSPSHMHRPRGARTPPGSPPRQQDDHPWQGRRPPQRRGSPPSRGPGPGPPPRGGPSHSFGGFPPRRGGPIHRRDLHPRRFNSRSPRRGRRAPPSDDEDPPDAYYAVSGDQV